jgi:hypothetical protein
MLMEDAMTKADKLTECMKPVVLARYLDDANSLYVLVISVLAILISLHVVWYAVSSGLVA